ncbi:hypothetical protein C8J57DRAFT_1475212 [Mycena rebaudengoi]|nr:hypothetical protein C8J57DRAFT_1475212 [Mycena rebaudengoi]
MGGITAPSAPDVGVTLLHYVFQTPPVRRAVRPVTPTAGSETINSGYMEKGTRFRQKKCNHPGANAPNSLQWSGHSKKDNGREVNVGYRLTSSDHCMKATREASKEPCGRKKKMGHISKTPVNDPIGIQPAELSTVKDVDQSTMNSHNWYYNNATGIGERDRYGLSRDRMRNRR